MKNKSEVGQVAELSAKFSGVDSLSAIFEKMANAGKKATEYLESAGKAANAAFSQAAASSNKLNEAAQRAQDAVKKQSMASEQAAKASVELSKAADSVTSTYTEMQDVLERTSQIAQAAADNDKVSADTKNKLAEANNNVLAAAKKLTQAQDEAAKAAETLIQAQNEAAKATENLTRVTQSGEASQEDIAKAAKQAANAENEIEKAATQAARAADNLARANDNAAAATRKAGQAADEAAIELKNNSVAMVEAAAQALAGLGFAALINVIKVGFKVAVGAAIEFESAITGVYKTVDGNSSQLKQIRDDIKAMSTEMPASALAIASVAESAGQLGVATDDITSFTKVILDKATGALNRSIDAVKTAARVETDRAKQLPQLEAYNAALTVESSIMEQIRQNVIEAQAARDRYRETAITDSTMDLSQLQADIDVFGSENAVLQAALSGTRGIINEIEQSWHEQVNVVVDYEKSDNIVSLSLRNLVCRSGRTPALPYPAHK